MKNFRLLLKNSVKSLWNSKVLVLQFTALTTIATVVISSVSLGNFSLRNSMAKVNKESNATGFSIENKNIEDFATYNAANSSQSILDYIDNLEINSAIDNNDQIYNPLVSQTNLSVNNGTPYPVYGFFQKYSNDGKYTTSDLSKQWNNIAFSKLDESLSIIVQLTDQSYKNRLSDIFTLYENILPPSPTEVESTNYEILFNENIYSFNPWSLFIDNGQMKTNNFGIGKVNGFNSADDVNTNIAFNHGVLDSLYSFIVGTNLTFLDESQMSQYSSQINTVNQNVKLSTNYSNLYANNWKQLSNINGFTDSADFNNFLTTWFPLYANNYINNYFPDTYYEFLNTLSNNVKSFMQTTKTFKIGYEMDVENSTGINNFFGDIYSNEKNPFYRDKNQIFNQESEKYFSGFFEIPIIPFITVLPKNNLSFAEYKEWASKSENYANPDQSIVNKAKLKSIASNILQKISDRSTKYFNDLLNSSSVNTNIRESYYKDYDIEYFLKNEMKFDFTKSSNFTLTDSNSNSFIMSKSDYFSDDKVNNIVLYEGRELFENKINKDYFNIDNINLWYSIWLGIIDEINIPSDVTNKEEYQKEFFLTDPNFFNLMKIYNQTRLNTSQTIIDDYYNLVSQINDIQLFNNNFSKWKEVTRKFISTYFTNSMIWNGAGYDIQFNRSSAAGIFIEFGANYYEPSSFMSILGLNYNQLKNNSKAIINSKFAEDAIKLPYDLNTISNDELLNNYEKYKDHYIYNPYTGTTEFYNDFLDWLSKLDSRYKIDINGDDFVIIGKGISTEFAYPITSSNQLLINNNAPVVFTNNLGYDKVFNNQDTKENSNYFVNFNHTINQIANNNDLNLVNEWTNRVNGNKLAYRLTDSSQPNQLLYLRINFPYSILNIVLVITIFVAAIIVFLSVIFMFILMRSIIRQNLNTFAVGMANGISKRKLLFSFIPFTLIPSGISAIIGYSLSFFIYPIISNAIQDYWILEYIRFNFSIGYLILVLIIITAIIFTVQVIVVFSVLNKNVSTLLVSKLEFRHNKLIQSAHKAVSKLKPLTSFRLTYMLGNFGRFLLLLLMMTSFVSLTTISATTSDTFNNAIQKTIENKRYNYAIDLYSPTEQGGLYYNIPYNLLGTRQQGLTSLYNLNSTTGFYTSDYKDDLTYNIPGTNESIVYENLFLPSSSIISDIQGELIYFRNRIIHMASMDFGINFVGNYINPWDWAKKIIPNSFISSIENNFQKQLNYAFAYVYSIQNEANNPDKDMWISDKSLNFADDLKNSSDPEMWDQSNWIYQYVKENNKYIWKSNDQLLSTGLPNFTMTQSAVYFVTRLISLSQNPEYLRFMRSYLGNNNAEVVDYNYMLALNVVPIIPNLDETYTYINATANFNKEKFEENSIKIYGIKPYSEQVVLWDEYNNLDLKQLLQEYENNSINLGNNIYPLIINEVVAKKYSLKVNDSINIKVNNKYKRFTDKFNNIENSETYEFKILGITTSKSEEQYYTTQNVANQLIDFIKPELANQYDLSGKNYDYKWVNQEEINNYIPFNGVFSKQELPKLLTNFATLYSPSGLSPIGGTLPIADRGDNYFQLYNNFSEINSILKCDIASENSGKSAITILDFCNKYQNLFGTNRYFNSALSSIDVTLASSLIGSVMDSTLSNINTICIIALLPSILIIIILMSYMIVVESRRLVALLKVLGFSNWTNTVTLSTVQFVVVGLSIILGYCFSLIILSVLKEFAFSSFNIIVNPIIPLWTIPVTIGALLLIISAITITIYFNLKKTNPAVEIAIR